MQNFREQNGGASLFEKLIVIANYFTFGLVGFIWLIFNALRGGRLSPFMQYHIFQSFFLFILYFLIIKFIELIAMILCWIPFLRGLVTRVLFFMNFPIVGHYSIVTGTVTLIIIYLSVTALQGQFSYIPWVSDIIKRGIRR